jgi:hypothetical protein
MGGRRMLFTVFLLVALLPLRGMAALAMHLPAFAPPAQQAPAAAPSAAQDPAGQASAAAPCHGAGHGRGDVGAVDPAADATPDRAACVLCDLCGGSVLVGRVEAFGRAETGNRPLRGAAAPRLPAGEPDPLLRPPRR